MVHIWHDGLNIPHWELFTKYTLEKEPGSRWSFKLLDSLPPILSNVRLSAINQPEITNFWSIYSIIS